MTDLQPWSEDILIDVFNEGSEGRDPRRLTWVENGKVLKTGLFADDLAAARSRAADQLAFESVTRVCLLVFEHDGGRSTAYLEAFDTNGDSCAMRCDYEERMARYQRLGEPALAPRPKPLPEASPPRFQDLSFDEFLASRLSGLRSPPISASSSVTVLPTHRRRLETGAAKGVNSDTESFRLAKDTGGASYIAISYSDGSFIHLSCWNYETGKGTRVRFPFKKPLIGRSRPTGPTEQLPDPPEVPVNSTAG